MTLTRDGAPEHVTGRLTQDMAARVLQRADLTAQERSIIDLRFTRSFSDEEIAKHCGFPVQAIREAFVHLAALAIRSELCG